MNLTQSEIERYAPYHTMQAFWRGFQDYTHGVPSAAIEGSGVDGQAYDRGAECAMRRQRMTERATNRRLSEREVEEIARGRITFTSTGATRKR